MGNLIVNLNPLIIDTEVDGQLWICEEGAEGNIIAQICHGELPDGKLEITQEDKAYAVVLAASVTMLRALKTAKAALDRINKSNNKDEYGNTCFIIDAAIEEAQKPYVRE
jgi:hypothetical protein